MKLSNGLSAFLMSLLPIASSVLLVLLLHSYGRFHTGSFESFARANANPRDAEHIIELDKQVYSKDPYHSGPIVDPFVDSLYVSQMILSWKWNLIPYLYSVPAGLFGIYFLFYLRSKKSHSRTSLPGAEEGTTGASLQ